MSSKSNIVYVTEVPDWLPDCVRMRDHVHRNDIEEIVQSEINELAQNVFPSNPYGTGFDGSLKKKIEKAVRMKSQQEKIVDAELSSPATKEVIPTPNPKQPPPAVPILKEVKDRKISDLEKLMHRRARACLDTHDYALYIATWNIWTEEYGVETIPPSDLDDIHAICMGTVREAREETIYAKNPDKYSRSNVEFARREIQKAKENLGTRRTDRENRKIKSESKQQTINIAVLAGQAQPDGIESIQTKIVENKTLTADFLNNTKSFDPFQKQKLIEESQSNNDVKE